MIAAWKTFEEDALEEQVSFRASEAPSVRRDVPSKCRMDNRARFSRRGGSANGFNGAHRRRNKRNYL